MAQTTEGASESVKVVAFSFMTSEEVRKHSAVKITAPILLDGMGRPVSGGLYDPAMGSLDETALCKSCGQRPFYCPGHCGHIDLVSPVYNPLLFIILHNLLQRTCFSCHHFRAGESEVEKCKSQLELILNGEVVEAKQLEELKDKDLVTEFIHSMHTDERKNMQPKTWTSLQFSEAISVVNKFLKPKQKTCKNCGAKNPKISKPTFGWLNMSGLAAAHKRANAIKGCKPVSVSSGAEGISSLEEETTISHPTVINTLEGDAFDDTASKAPVEDSEEVSPVIFMQKNFSSGHLMPSEVKDILKRLWKNEATLCSFISDIRQQGHGNKAGHSIFFLESVLVPPIKFRPPAKGGDSVMEHPQTVLLNKVLQSNISLGNAHANKSEHTKIVRLWMDLQQSINILFDSKTAVGPGKKDASLGICQLLEKKEGMFRQKMMGKRVNFACRSVISPDPYLAVNEIGIPPYFALRLTYPERVTAWNVQKLRNAIINGPETHPGATHYIDKLATVKLNLKPSRKSRISISRKLPSSRGVVVDQGSDDYEFEGKIVNRHLQDGDIVLVNRQPTLHKPSIMAHVVRVLKGEKTIRMHYANCSTYNADFDGDEMNVHFPQDEISRAEAYNIVNANNQYVKPTSGEPIRALIQDHIISAVLLTKKDTFLNFVEFSQLLYSSGISTSRAHASSEKPGQKIFTLDFEAEMLPVLPAVWKPEPLWTGKQVVTALLDHITRGSPPFCVEKDVKIPRGFFKCRDMGNNSSKVKMVDGDKSKRKRTMNDNKLGKGEVLDEGNSKEYSKVDKLKAARLDDDSLLIFKNELVRGVIDKAQFGDYGLVHTVQELYGSNTAGLLLSVMSRLFTVFLQTHGFTCGVDDLLLIEYMDKEREKQLQICEKIGEQVHLGFLKVKDGEKLDPMTLQLNIEKTISNNGESALTSLDRKMTSQLNERTGNSKVLKDLLSEGLLKPSVKNCISLMTTSGAKGGTANFQQISSHLGQQQLEGKRVPRMVSGKTLPCFPPWDWASRAGGFIVDRFLTGLRPQEYYFHCMAGREGLVDTAVKTSRSGYLQRCLIKNLESLKICYDHTVRDADGSVIQFQYGEDGVDVHKTAFITKFEALAANQDMLCQKSHQQLGKYNLFIHELPSALQEKAEFIYNSLSKDKVPGLVQKEDFVRLLENKYLSSLAQPGEPVGVLAAQSIGEPSTQMTLNTFHHAGRGEMNVTLGIPRLQEILMTASQDIKTPIMTCPLREGHSMDVAKCLANKLKKITVADIIENMNVTVVPFSQRKREICSIYKLQINFYPLENNPQYAHVSPEDLEATLEIVFLRALEDSIQNEMLLLSKINGIKNFVPDSQSKGSSERDEASSSSQHEENDDDDDLGNDLDVAEDLGLDMKKQKLQATDEMDYEDDSEDELNAKEPSAGFESEVDQGDEAEITNDDDMMEIVKDGTSENQTEMVDVLKSKSEGKTTKAANKKKRVKLEFSRYDYDRSIFVEAKGNHFEVHFKFTNEPHILLTQIAQKTAQKVSIQSSGKIIRCQQITCKEGQVIYYGNNAKERKKIKPEEKEKIPALQTSGVDFMTLWELQDELDVRYIYSNDIHAMLQTYGVEAARETIIREIQNIFTSYGISVNMRHLTLVADYMTHSGGYRPMNRLGGIADSISPFSRMTFETASKFIVQAAFHGEVDALETPSSRICLGLPVKMGTGSFDLMQKIEV